MRSCKEMRQDAWNILTGSKWGWKILLNGIVLYAILVAVMIGLEFLFEAAGIQTWSSFREAQIEAMRSGVTLTIASGYEALRMTFASGFSTFVEYLFSGIIAFGLVTTFLKCVKNDSEGWFADAFGGFKRPFGLLWLLCLMGIMIILWALLFVIVGGFFGGIVSAVLRVCGMVTEKQMGVLIGCMCGIPASIAAIVVSFRYAFAWYFKVEDPETGAYACLTKSSELMRGRKWKLFLFLLSYIGWFILALLPVFFALGTLSASAAADGANGEPPLESTEISMQLRIVLIVGFSVSILLMVFVGIYAAIGKAIFYRDAKAETCNAKAEIEASESEA